MLLYISCIYLHFQLNLTLKKEKYPSLKYTIDGLIKLSL